MEYSNPGIIDYTLRCPICKSGLEISSITQTDGPIEETWEIEGDPNNVFIARVGRVSQLNVTISCDNKKCGYTTDMFKESKKINEIKKGRICLKELDPNDYEVSD